MHPQLSVVTGGAGFLGQALVRRLLDIGDRVRAVVLPGDPHAAALRTATACGERLEIVAADVTDAAAIAAAIAGPSRVFHSAALIHTWSPWADFRRVNVGGTQNVARAAAAAGVERLVAMSTTDVFGVPRRGEPLDESSPLQPWSEPYADTKIEAERWLWGFARDARLRLTVMYPGWIYGPGDRAFFPGLAAAIANGRMTFWSDDIRLPWAYIDNLVDACLLASTAPAAVGQGYIVHDESDGPSLQDVCARIATAIGAPVPTRRVPYGAAYAAAWIGQRLWRLLRMRSTPPLLTVDVKAFGHQWHLPTTKIRKELGWTPSVSIASGMQRALDALRQTWRASEAQAR